MNIFTKMMDVTVGTLDAINNELDLTLAKQRKELDEVTVVTKDEVLSEDSLLLQIQMEDLKLQQEQEEYAEGLHTILERQYSYSEELYNNDPELFGSRKHHDMITKRIIDSKIRKYYTEFYEGVK